MNGDVWAAAVAVTELPDGLGEVAWTREELGRAERFHRAEDRRSYLAAHRLVRTVAARALGVVASELTYRQSCDECKGTDHGRPWLQHANRRIPVSVSHSQSAVACAVGAHSTVDVDEIEGFDHALPGVLSTNEETRAGRAADPAVLRARLWTLKECLVKQGWATLDELGKVDVMDAVEQGVFHGGVGPMRVLRLPVTGGDGRQLATLLAPAEACVSIEEGM